MAKGGEEEERGGAERTAPRDCFGTTRGLLSLIIKSAFVFFFRSSPFHPRFFSLCPPPRFSKEASCLSEALANCLFRILNIVDPADSTKRVIMRLEHEITSSTTVDGGYYQNFPFKG